MLKGKHNKTRKHFIWAVAGISAMFAVVCGFGVYSAISVEDMVGNENNSQEFTTEIIDAPADPVPEIIEEEVAPEPEPVVEEPAPVEVEEVSYESSDESVSYPSGGQGVLTKAGGVNYYNGKRETWYSQKVLPGGGLNIPGRHVAKDGTVRDADGYICVASSDLPYGSTVETSLGMGKVYDSGCAPGTVDLYVNW